MTNSWTFQWEICYIKRKKKTFLGKVFTQNRLSQKLETIFFFKFYASNQTSWGSHVERGWVSCVNSRHWPLQLTSRMLSRAVSSVLAIKANPRHRLSNLSISLFFFLGLSFEVVFSPSPSECSTSQIFFIVYKNFERIGWLFCLKIQLTSASP